MLTGAHEHSAIHARRIGGGAGSDHRDEAHPPQREEEENAALLLEMEYGDRDDDDDKADRKHAKSKPTVPAVAAAVSASAGKGPTKVLFLDGVRGLAAILVVTQHSGFMGDVNLGACAVDIFFVLSSFLLTWLFYKKSAQLLAQKATLRKWGFALADYFSKRFFRVYPLFAIVAIFLWLLPFKYQHKYYLVKDHYDLFQVLTFEFNHRYHVFWTLPLEIAYYFLIPVVVLIAIGLKRAWWLPCIPLYIWIIERGLYGYRTSHYPLAPHMPTFLSGSLAAILFVKLDGFIKERNFEFKNWQKRIVWSIEFVVFWTLLSVCFQGLAFHWIHENPVPKAIGFPYVSLLVTILILIEMILPSPLSTVFEWSVLRYWGKISFSVYLLHSFVIYNDTVRSQHNYYDKLFGQFFLVFLLATASYHLIEYPSQLLSTRISKALAQRERDGAASASKTSIPAPVKKHLQKDSIDSAA